MKALFAVESYYPARHGMAEVVRQLAERFVLWGHEITIATSKNPERTEKVISGAKIEEFEISGNTAKGLKGEVDKYKEFLSENEFDAVVLFAAQQWSCDIALDMLSQFKGRKIFVPTGFSGLKMSAYKDYYRKMQFFLHQFDANIFHSTTYQDILFAIQHKAPYIYTIPNAADEREFSAETNIDIKCQLNIPKDYFLILHVGSRTGLKGHSEALNIFSKAGIKNSALLFIGGKTSGLATLRDKFFERKVQQFQKITDTVNKIVMSTELSRDETIASFKQADLFLFPSNIECSPLVLFESMASRTPFLSSDAGNCSEIAEWSKSGIILPTRKLRGLSFAKINKSAKILEEIYNDKSKRETMAENGYREWFERFTWEKTAKEYEKLILGD